MPDTLLYGAPLSLPESEAGAMRYRDIGDAEGHKNMRDRSFLIAILSQGQPMAVILLETTLPTDIGNAFDLSRSIDFHLLSASQTQERAIAGRTEGLIELGEWTRWRAKHFGLWLELEVEITAMQRPHFFQDEMREGAFAYMRHEHHFESLAPDRTLMRDRFEFASPLGPLGKVVDALVLKNYMTRFLITRNNALLASLPGVSDH